MALTIGLWVLAAIIFGIYLALSYAVRNDKRA
ncbi:hypothetical protein BV058_00926 [Haemophilus influenzae]|uniref:Uncharacterized protein n=1 Tax=Haemophilus influenzae TaxID=727 RepID=A0AB37B2N7_HAEIF|nr:hypothetical protein BV025_00993 [Haemophilus influenzae]PRJ23582.1 hypothetical protein BV056_00446 [Haemophilus influenzae]PRJ69777.1 hypothetical protein BV115_00240 [Haemophilus influenzae]PRL64181.1 hypothetical protein BV059_01040 [Haemophilus influenzae]PRL65186.1 hypothetical protein BV058_00926 [Haemophilus influenzae]